MDSKYPPKLGNLFFFKERGLDIPPFIFITSEDIENTERKLLEIKEFFNARGVKSVIIRSAGSGEDLEEKTQAGIFESSEEIPLKELAAESIKHFWEVNVKRAAAIGCPGVFLFIQEYFRADYSGVLFTQTPYDRDEAVLKLSSSPQAITRGGNPEITVRYKKDKDSWQDGNFLTGDLKDKLINFITNLEEKFPGGADVELGIKQNKIKIYQVRPITRNKDEKILWWEKQRLKEIFRENFENQVWEITPFTQSLGKLTLVSLNFYNALLNSEELYELLKEARLVEKKKRGPAGLRILENIGGKTYLNLSQEKTVFPKRDGWWANFKKTVLVLSYEKIMRQENSIFARGVITIEKSFAWFVLSGFYLQLFLGREKRKHNFSDFIKRLKNTEGLCKALEPRPAGPGDKAIDDFIAEYYYLADNPYELADLRIREQKKEEVRPKYRYFEKEAEKIHINECLGEKVHFWLKNKIFWKQTFLKLLAEHRQSLAQKYRGELYSCSGAGLSDAYLRISGRGYPFPGLVKQDSFIIVPGEIDSQNLVFLSQEDDITRYLHRYIAISNFPNSWIHFIPQLKGVVLETGNELSHMAITCREYEVPCRVIPSFFEPKRKV